MRTLDRRLLRHAAWAIVGGVAWFVSPNWFQACMIAGIIFADDLQGEMTDALKGLLDIASTPKEN